MPEPGGPRRYNSARRRESAEATRRRVLDAAHRLFAERGYAATTLPEIAAEARVATPTITAVFRTKPALLQALIQRMVRGDLAPEPLAQRPSWQEMLDEPDPTVQLALFAGASRRIHEHTTDIAEIVRGAATADPAIAALRADLGERRLRDVRTLAESIAKKRVLRPGTDAGDALDLLWALGSADLFRLLVVDRGWSADRYERWLAATLTGALLDIPGKPASGDTRG